MNGNIVLGDLSSSLLAPLGYYGGPTRLRALLPGSSAIGKGTLSFFLQPWLASRPGLRRGEPLDSPVPDIGAFQNQTALIVNSTADGTGSTAGPLTLRAAIDLGSVLGSSQTITFDAHEDLRHARR